MKKGREAFTLVELLVVIGIIIVLIGLLLPVLRMVRIGAYTTRTQAQIKNISNACDRYFGDFAAYPGVFSNTNTAVTSPTATTYALTWTTPSAGSININRATSPGSWSTWTGWGSTKKITSSENLVLALMGGLSASLTQTGVWSTTNSPSAPPYGFDSSTLGMGPMSLSMANPKRFSAYMQYVPAQMTKGTTGRVSGLQGSLLTTTACDSEIPEFMDGFPGNDGVIIYLRANVGYPGVAAANNTVQYNTTDITNYTGGTYGSYSYFPYTGIDKPTADFTIDTYFTNPNVSGIPRQKDGYWLISPGPDRRYGTKDDITNFGGVR